MCSAPSDTLIELLTALMRPTSVQEGQMRTWEDRDEADTECQKSSPIYSIPISIHPMWAIQLWNVDLLFLDNPVFCDHNRGDRAEPDRVTRHKVEETDGIREDIPRYKGPSPDKCSDNLTTAKVDVLWTKRHQVDGS